jgi:3-deoxy-D-manno-octulosonic-acid transferase
VHAAYQILIRLYYLALWLASPFSGRAKQWLAGRRLNPSLLEKWQPQPGRRTIWMHVASLGEFEQGRHLIEQWKQRCPSDRIVLSFYSPSGYNIRKNWPLADLVIYLPHDTKKEMNRLVNRLQPDLLILVKYDFWPNMLHVIHERNIPACLVSARFRSGQYLFAAWGKPFLQQIRQFRWIFVQDEESAILLKEHGIDHAVVAGDTRVDAVMRRDAIAGRDVYKRLYDPSAKVIIGGGRDVYKRLYDPSAKVIIGGSTWPPEEKMLAEFWKSSDFHKIRENWKLVIAPHDISESHLVQIDRLFGGGITRLSTSGTTIEQALDQNDIIIIDSIGLLSSLYALADIAVIGGGFGKGIHNILEPAAFGLPVLFGPAFNRFNEAEAMTGIGAAFPVTDFSSLSSTLLRLCSDSQFRSESGNLAVSYMKSQMGSTDLIIRHLLETR